MPELRQRGAQLETIGGSTGGDEFQAGRSQGMQMQQIKLPKEVL